MRILVAREAPEAEPSLQTLLQKEDPKTIVVSRFLSADILDQVETETFDGVVCRADRTDTMDLVSAIRGRNSEVPIVVLGSNVDPAFETRARSKGASSVRSLEAGAAAIAETLRQIFQLRAAMRATREKTRTTDRLRAELREAILDRQVISQ